MMSVKCLCDVYVAFMTHHNIFQEVKGFQHQKFYRNNEMTTRSCGCS